MTLKKLSAGSGYEYLIRQVAAADSTELGTTPLGDYYSAKGEAPGRWTGAGLVGLAGIEHGDVVTAKQMQNLFGEGRHPVTGHPLGRAYRPDAVAGFDLTFSPVKSVSALWAVSDPEVAKAIEQAHADAVADALGSLEQHAIFTREGTDGVRQVETRGLIAAAFTHRDSRAGDPDLHTHVAVANKVQTLHGKWLSIYGTVLHRYVVAASETYNTALEHHLHDRLGLVFTERSVGPGKRPVREVAGVDPRLCAQWSSRRRDIEGRLDELRAEFSSTHGRAPTEKEAIALAQRANLETRAAKHEPRSEAEQRATWREEAAGLLGDSGVRRIVQDALSHGESRQEVTDEWLADTTERIIAELESHRATWQSWHLYAEVQRQVRDVDLPGEQVGGLVEHLVERVTATLINLTPDMDPITEPSFLRRSDGTSVYRHTGADHFTSRRMLEAEERIVTAAGRITMAPDPDDVSLALMEVELDGVRLNDGQHDLVLGLLSDPRQVALALAPAGAGKTTAMRALAATAANLGQHTIGLAPSAAAAAVLGEATRTDSETLAMFDVRASSGIDNGIGPNTVVVIDEAGMADTPTLDRVIATCTAAGARVRLIGDDQQLAAVGAGGVLRDIAHTHGVTRLDDVVRFVDPVEAHASVDLRSGDRAAIGFYLDHGRIHTGDDDACLSDVLTAWQADQVEGRECLMLAPTRELVARLNHAARATRLGGFIPVAEVELADGNRASVGDRILTRQNKRRLGVSATDWVRNGDRWTVTHVGRDGDLGVRHVRSGLRVVLPADYVTAHVQLGYASTVHTAQGSTADTMHGILTGHEDRQMLYTMLTRGRLENHVHLIVEPVGGDDEPFLPGIDEHLTAVEMLDRVIDRDGAAISATTELATSADPTAQLHDASRRYYDSVSTVTARLLGRDAAEALYRADTGPLPWLPGIPAEVQTHSEWCGYLMARADRVSMLADRVRRVGELPDSVAHLADRLTPELREEIMVWRASNGVAPHDRSLLGPVTDPFIGTHARRLLHRIDEHYPPTVRRWEERIATVIGSPNTRDEHTLRIACELDQLGRAGYNTEHLIRRAATGRPLPEEHTVEALRYRVQRIVKHSQEAAALEPNQAQRRPEAGLGL